MILIDTSIKRLNTGTGRRKKLYSLAAIFISPRGARWIFASRRREKKRGKRTRAPASFHLRRGEKSGGRLWRPNRVTPRGPIQRLSILADLESDARHNRKGQISSPERRNWVSRWDRRRRRVVVVSPLSMRGTDFCPHENRVSAAASQARADCNTPSHDLVARCFRRLAVGKRFSGGYK